MAHQLDRGLRISREPFFRPIPQYIPQPNSKTLFCSSRYLLWLQNFVHPRYGLTLKIHADMAVSVEHHADLRITKKLLDNLWMFVLLKKPGGEGMPAG